MPVYPLSLCLTPVNEDSFSEADGLHKRKEEDTRGNLRTQSLISQEKARHKKTNV